MTDPHDRTTADGHETVMVPEGTGPTHGIVLPGRMAG